ncbi:MAG: 50S ribosomal protein L18e [Candidatus Woesearchaeota archaeon]|nr:MAG: 50S ribosomal protein L18e [Candidatus Woesearchaeota archaeon]
MKRVKNERTEKLIAQLERAAHEQKSPLWKRLAVELAKPTRNLREVNLYKLNQYSKPDEILLVPGKVLAVGELDHTITLAAFKVSGQAREKILGAKGKLLTVEELMKKAPKGTNVRIIG